MTYSVTFNFASFAELKNAILKFDGAPTNIVSANAAVEASAAAIVPLSRRELPPVPSKNFTPSPAVNEAISEEEKPPILRDKPKAPSAAPMAPAVKPEKAAVKKAEEMAAPAIAYDDVKNIILALAKKDREQAVALLADFGVKLGSELAKSEWAAFVKKGEAKLKALDASADLA